MSEQSIGALVDRMRMSSGREAEQVRWLLEAAYLPNQVLKPGSDQLVESVFAGLASATPDGALESWEILGQAAAGTTGQTAADSGTVQNVRGVLLRNADLPVDRLVDAEPQSYDFLAVDVIDVMLEFADSVLRVKCLAALSAFSERGAKEKKRVAAMLGA